MNDAKQSAEPAHRSTATMLIATDLGPASTAALRQGLSTAHRLGTRPHVITVAGSSPPGVSLPGEGKTESFSIDEARQFLSEYVQSALDVAVKEHGSLSFDMAVSHVRIGDPIRQILQLAVDLEADLIVVGSHARDGVKRALLGSIAEKIVRGSKVPVLVVPLVEAEEEVIQIEPACPLCLDERRRTLGQQLWCSQHREHRDHHNTHHQIPHKVQTASNHPLMISMR